MNQGKQFEKDFIDSIPGHIFRYRLKDGTAAWGGQADNVRFQSSNICDFIVHNGETLYLLELKSHKGKSIPVTCFRKNQLEGMIKANEYNKVKPYFIINFRDINETYAIHVIELNKWLQFSYRKSIPLEVIKKYGVIIPQTLKKVHYRYDLSLLEGVS